MKIFRLTTKRFTLEFGSKPKILFTVSILFLTGGIGMLTENLWIHLIDTAVEILLKKEQNYSNEIIGTILLIIGLILLYVGLKNWKIDIYLQLYKKVQKTLNELYTTLHMRERGFDKILFQNQHDLIYRLYIEGTEYVDEHKIQIDKTIALEARGVLFECAKELEYFQATIIKTEKLKNGQDEKSMPYSPSQDFKETVVKIDEIKSRYEILETALRNKLKWKFS